MCIFNGFVQRPNNHRIVSSIRKNRTVKESSKNLYADREKTGDVCFIVGVGSERVYAHRCVLAAISSKFEAQFYGSTPVQGDVKVSDEYTVCGVAKFIEFFYLEEILLSTKMIEEVLVLAKESLVDEFVQLCVDFLVDVTPLDNLFLGYRLAHSYDIDELKHLSGTLIKNSTAKMFESNDFLVNCDDHSLLSVLKMDALNCKESELFNACIKWAKNACERSNTDPDKVENLRSELDDIINEIRFCSMTIEEFAIIKRAHRNFFSSSEFEEIIYLVGHLEGYQSKKFNQRPRHLPENLRSIPSLQPSISTERVECNRAVNESPDFYVNGFTTSFMSFQCNRTIRLEGFAIGCIQYERVADPVLTFNELKHNRKIPFKSKIENGETIITFNDPIYIVPKEKIGIVCSIASVQMMRKFEWSNSVTMGNVTFMFDKNEINNDRFITKLLYGEV